jgi:hypothetical protein
MNILALTHAHLKPDGLSPVSCERADSIVAAWGAELKWDVDIIQTHGTRWAGIWPDGKGLKANIISPVAPKRLMMVPEELFSDTVKSLLRKKQLRGVLNGVAKKVAHRLRGFLAKKGFVYPAELLKAEQWGLYLGGIKEIVHKKYDFIFVCVGYGDEYLLQTALTLSKKLHTSMVVDFRDLWSNHHDTHRFTEKQRKIIRKYEFRLLSNTILLSVPQKPMAEKLEQYLNIPVHITSHSAHINENWPDGEVVVDELRLLYAGKVYAGNEGLTMLLEMLQKLALEKLIKPLKCHFFVDDCEALENLMSGMGIEHIVMIHSWVTPEAIWKEMRSAHILLVFDGGFYQRMPLLMTKTFQYAHSGRPILALSKYGNTTYDTFFKTFDAGVVCQTVNEAAKWVKKISENEKLYQVMPPLKKVPMRREMAIEFARAIENILKAKLYQ